MGLIPALLALVLVAIEAVHAQQQTPPPGSIPLAVRSPYLSVWQGNATGNSNTLTHSWPEFWGQMSGQTYIQGWEGMVRVDNTTYTWIGDDPICPHQATVTSTQVTPTRSIYTLIAGPMNLTVTFLSPIETSDWVKQSMPFSYASIEATSMDGNSHQVQIYSDITAEWVSLDRSLNVDWSNATSTESSLYHQISLQSPQPWIEDQNISMDGTAYYATSAVSGLSWQINWSNTTRYNFISGGVLPNTDNTTFGPIGPVVFTTFAFAHNLGDILSTSSPVTYAVGFVRNPSIQYVNGSGQPQTLRPYYVTQYPSGIGSVIDAFLGDFSSASNRSIALDEKIRADAAQISEQYVDLVSLAARQTMGALDFTTSSEADSAESSNPLIFMKNVGSDRRVNPVERMFAAFPVYLYLNASLCGAMLSPLLSVQDSQTGPYAAQDIGSSYPQARTTESDSKQGVEQSSNMLIMLYAYARFSGDRSLISQHYGLIKRWGDYLSSNTLAFNDQVTADIGNPGNSTNLDIKGIIGVKAAAEIARTLDQTDDAQSYNNVAKSFLSTWLSHAQPSGQSHLLGTYGNPQTWSLMYNIYADKLLGTGLVSDSTLDAQTSYYGSLLSNGGAYGLAIDSSSSYGSSVWTMLTAAFVTNSTVRDQLIAGVWSTTRAQLGAFADQYNYQTGAFINGTASPALGSAYSFLALNLTVKLDSTVSPSMNSGKKSKTAPIVGSVIGAAALVSILIVGVYVWRRRQSRRTSHGGTRAVEDLDEPTVIPFGYYTDTDVHEGISSSGATVLAPASTSAVTSSVSSKAHGRVPTGQPQSRSVSHAGDVDVTTDGRAMSEISPSDVIGLRAEVENLRQVMHAMRTDRLEPPPEYRSEYGEQGEHNRG